MEDNSNLGIISILYRSNFKDDFSGYWDDM